MTTSHSNIVKYPLEVQIEKVGKKIFCDADEIGSGGTANVFKAGNLAVKIYHDRSKMISAGKIRELQTIQSDVVVKPLYTVYDKKNKEIGYAMQHIQDFHPLIKLFTKSFQRVHNLSFNDTAEIVKQIQLTFLDIHKSNNLVADPNEMNIIMSDDCITPYFIDVDGYQTPNYRALALSETIRDPLMKYEQDKHDIDKHYALFTNLTDWYGFGILAFSLYVGIHAFRCYHPDYKDKDWRLKMDNGVSGFNPDSEFPPNCNDLSMIPKPHAEWMEKVFSNKDRSVPPLIDGTIPIAVPDKIVVVQHSDQFIVEFKGKCDEDIQSVFDFSGVRYFITKDSIYRNEYKIRENLKSDNFDKVFIQDENYPFSILCGLKNKNLVFQNLITGDEIGSTKADDIFYHNGKCHSVSNTSLFEHDIMFNLGKPFHKATKIGKVYGNSTVYDGVLFQRIVGKPFLSIPCGKKCSLLRIKELDDYRVVDMDRSDKFCIIAAERSGIYSRFILMFNDDYSSYTIRVDEDIVYDGINFAELPNGICCLSTDGSKAEIFNVKKVKKFDKAPFDSSMKLFSSGSQVFFIIGKEIFHVRTK